MSADGEIRKEDLKYGDGQTERVLVGDRYSDRDLVKQDKAG